MTKGTSLFPNEATSTFQLVFTVNSSTETLDVFLALSYLTLAPTPKKGVEKEYNLPQTICKRKMGLAETPRTQPFQTTVTEKGQQRDSNRVQWGKVQALKPHNLGSQGRREN